MYTNADLRWHPAWERLSAAPPEWYKSNGATNAPDRIGVVDLRPAAHRHDYRYEKGGTEWDRYVADMLFLYDAIQCCLVFAARTRLAKSISIACGCGAIATSCIPRAMNQRVGCGCG
jgi:hypothetical protein